MTSQLNPPVESIGANALRTSLLLIYFLSGTAALAYEVLWARMLSLQFGVSIFGVVVTVFAFMSGLGAGALLGRRLCALSVHPLLLFAVLEFCVAVFALALPAVYGFLQPLLDTLLMGVGLGGWQFLQASFSALILTLPALALGSGFALFLKAANDHASVGEIYGLNTVGGALGALLPLLLLPLLGWLNATQVVAGIGMLVALGSFILMRFVSVASDESVTASKRPPWFDLLCYGGIGFAAIVLEIAWVRLFGMIVLRTEYVMAVMLAVYLAGIGLGSLLARWLPVKASLTALPWAMVLSVLFSILALPWLAGWAASVEFASFPEAVVSQSIVLAALMFPATLILGIWFPQIVRRFGQSTAAWFYGVNALFAALGALAAAMLFLPLAGSGLSMVLVALLFALFGARWMGNRRAAFALLPLLALPLLINDMPPAAKLAPVALAETSELNRHEDAVAVTHVVERASGERLLLGDLQRMDASTDPFAVISQRNQARLPLLLHKDPRQVLFLGLGTGITADAANAWPQAEITAVELSLGAIQATTAFFDRALSEDFHRVHIVHDDARRFLKREDSRFDVIVGDLFHPDLVGRSALLSRQHFERVRQRLAPGGHYVQWIALNQFDPDSLEVVLRTFAQVYPNNALFLESFRLALVGYHGRTTSFSQLADSFKGAERIEERSGGEGMWTWLGRFWGAIEPSSGPVQDEWAPVIEYALPRARFNGELELRKVAAYLQALRSNDADLPAALGLRAEHAKAFEGARRASLHAFHAHVAMFSGDGATSSRLLRQAYEANPADRWVAYGLIDRGLQNLPLVQARGMDPGRYLDALGRLHAEHPELIKLQYFNELSIGNESTAEALRQRYLGLAPYARLPESAPVSGAVQPGL